MVKFKFKLLKNRLKVNLIIYLINKYEYILESE